MPELTHAVYRKGDSPIDLARRLDESCDQDHNQGTPAMAANDNKEEDINVFGEQLSLCSVDPVTGFYRDGCCSTSDEDRGRHVVCTEVTAAFLEFSKRAGNDLSTPRPEFGFPGLVAGNRWCLVAGRWAQAHEARTAPRVYLRATNEAVLGLIPLSTLRAYALDLN